MVILLARLKRCALSLYATVSVKLLQLPCAWPTNVFHRVHSPFAEMRHLNVL